MNSTNLLTDARGRPIFCAGPLPVAVGSGIRHAPLYAIGRSATRKQGTAPPW